MHFVFDNLHYYIKFFKTHVTKNGKDCIDTICCIDVKYPEGEQIYSTSSFACQSHKDKYNKILGKKIALTRALHNHFSFSHSKALRTKFWEEFHKTFKRWS